MSNYPNSNGSMPSPPAKAENRKHTQTYHCVPCHASGVECFPGSSDHPDKPPCVRCRREGLECFVRDLRNKPPVKGSPRKPTDVFPRHSCDRDPIGEGVASRDTGRTRDIPSDAVWTNVDRPLVQNMWQLSSSAHWTNAKPEFAGTTCQRNNIPCEGYQDETQWAFVDESAKFGQQETATPGSTALSFQNVYVPRSPKENYTSAFSSHLGGDADWTAFNNGLGGEFDQPELRTLMDKSVQEWANDGSRLDQSQKAAQSGHEPQPTSGFTEGASREGASRNWTKSKGCETCKKWNIRCDEYYPQCRNCTMLQVRCDYMDGTLTPDNLKLTFSELQSATIAESEIVNMPLETSIRSGGNTKESETSGLLEFSPLVAMQSANVGYSNPLARDLSHSPKLRLMACGRCQVNQLECVRDGFSPCSACRNLGLGCVYASLPDTPTDGSTAAGQPAQRECVRCHTQETAEWHREPSGESDLCTFCVIFRDAYWNNWWLSNANQQSRDGNKAEYESLAVPQRPLSRIGDAVPSHAPLPPSPTRNVGSSESSVQSKQSVFKAISTSRDPTSDRMNADRVRYVPRETYNAGEEQITQTGHLLHRRQYRIRIFLLPNWGENLLMLASECAQVLGYRDSDDFFNSNAPLYQLIASQDDKDELVRQRMLQESERGREVFIVTAKSMYQQFGSLIIHRRQDPLASDLPSIDFDRLDREAESRITAAQVLQGTRSQDAVSPNQPQGAYHLKQCRQQEATHSSEQTDHKISHFVPSDSGYHSGIGTDTESACSEGSIGSSLGLSQDFLQEFVAFFGDVLIERAGARNWAEHALAQHPPEVIDKKLNALLKEYAVELVEKKDILVEDHLKNRTPARAVGTDVRIATGATKLIRRYRPKITRYFRDNVSTTPVTAESITSRLQEMSKQLSLTEKLNLFEKPTESRSDPNEGLDELPAEDEDDVEDGGDYTADLQPIRDFLVSGEPFRHLVTAMRRTLYHDDQSVMEEVRRHVVAALISEGISICSQPGSPLGHHATQSGDVQQCSCLSVKTQLNIKVEWDLLGFIRSKFSSPFPHLGSLVTITGSALYAQATTCAEYLKSTWPCSGKFFLDCLQDVMDKMIAGAPSTDDEISYTSHDLGMKIALVYDGWTIDEIVAEGPAQTLLELSQQVAWIGAALDSSPFNEQLAYSAAVVTSSFQCLTMHFSTEKLYPTESSCWLPLFSGATIARGFPIPERQDETGLEIPIDIMAALAGVRHAVEYAGSVVMKGFSSMFVPVKKMGNLVQWHFISSPDCETRLSYADALQRCKTRATIKEVSLDSLRTTRAIVGWCTAASTTLGSDLANYENIDYSGAKDAENTLKFAGGTLGFQQFGVAQANFSLGPKDGKCHFQRNGPYRRIVSAADKTPIALYDTAENRAWLVPASSVILHIAQHRNWIEPFEVNGQPFELMASSTTGSSTKDILLRNAWTELSINESYTFRDMVTSIWSLLEFLIDQDVRIDRAPGTAIETPYQELLKGYEFKAVVEERSPFRQKETTIKKTCGGWPTLVRDIDALVLFANGFEDLIQPLKDANAGLCSSWQRVPKWKDYMTTSVKTLNDLYDVAGCRLNRDYLTSTQLQWHRGSSALFESCKTPGAWRCKCVRLQQIVRKSAVGTIVPPGPLDEEGAVIFGHSSSVLQRLTPVCKAPAAKGLYSQPNLSLAPVVVCQDSDETQSVTSDSQTVGLTWTDGTERTYSSSITSYTNDDEPSHQGINMTGLALDATPSRKRPWPADDSCHSLMTPNRHCLFVEPHKRTKNGEDSADINAGYRECPGGQKCNDPATLDFADRMLSPFACGEEAHSNPPGRQPGLRRQTAQTFSRRSFSGNS